MREVLDQHPEVIDAAEEAIRRVGVEPKHTIIRGGTDGAGSRSAGCRRRTSSPAAKSSTRAASGRACRTWPPPPRRSSSSPSLGRARPRNDGAPPRCSAAGSVPGRRVMDPAAPDHRRDHLDVAQLLGLDRERVAVEHDEIGEVAGEELAAPALVVREPGRARRRSRAAPARPSAPAPAARPDARRSSGARRRRSRPAGRAPRPARRSRSRPPRPSRAASGTRTCRRSGRPRSAPRGRGPRARARTAPSRRRRARRSGARPPPRGTARARSAGGGRAAARRPGSPRTRRARPVRLVADRVHGDRPAGSAPRRTISSSSSRLVISTPVPSVGSAVCEPSVPSMKHFR